MKRLSIVILALGMWQNAAFGGIVSGGGGGVTNPDPATPSQIYTFVTQNLGRLSEAWFNRQLAEYWLLPAAERESSPVARFFNSQHQVFDVLMAVKVTIRTAEPCYGALGEPVDASFTGGEIPRVCFSAHTMAPKLNKYNYREELLALFVHELSHVLGADEDQATEIQTIALDRFHGANLDTVEAVLAEEPRGGFWAATSHIDVITERLLGEPELAGGRKVTTVENQMRILTQLIEDETGTFSYIGPYDWNRFEPQFIRLSALYDYFCAEDPNERGREYCQRRLDSGFAGEERVSAADYHRRSSPANTHDEFDYRYDQFILRRPDNQAIAASELHKLGTLARSMLHSYQELKKFKLDVDFQ